MKKELTQAVGHHYPNRTLDRDSKACENSISSQALDNRRTLHLQKLVKAEHGLAPFLARYWVKALLQKQKQKLKHTRRELVKKK